MPFRMLTLFLASVLLGASGAAIAAEGENPNYLYVMKFVIAPGQTPAQGIETASEMVRVMRKSGDWKNVRLYFHDTGPDVAVYTFAEAKSWAAIETGNAKMVEAMDIMNTPFQWGGHSDNLLVEIPVE